MPDTLTREALDEIRWRDSRGNVNTTTKADRRALLAHIDALTAAGQRVESEYDAISGWHDVAYEGVTDALYALFAILRGDRS